MARVGVLWLLSVLLGDCHICIQRSCRLSIINSMGAQGGRCGPRSLPETFVMDGLAGFSVDDRNSASLYIHIAVRYYQNSYTPLVYWVFIRSCRVFIISGQLDRHTGQVLGLLGKENPGDLR